MTTDITLRLRQLEERLERLLVSGWRNAGSEAAELVTEAEALTALGLTDLADRLRAVAVVEGGLQALRAVALTATACRLLRARLPADQPPPVEWSPLGQSRRRQATAAERLLPLGRIALAGDEAWACLRLRGSQPNEWLLLDPPALTEPPPAPERPQPGLAARLLGRRRQADDRAGPPSAWLRCPVEGQLHWRARYPLGASGEVQRCTLPEPSWAPLADGDGVLLDTLRKALTGRSRDDQPVFGPWLHLTLLDPADADSYVWPDPATTAAFRASSEPVWALTWVQGGSVAPLVLVHPGRPPRLTHLVPGTPTEPLPD